LRLVRRLQILLAVLCCALACGGEARFDEPVRLSLLAVGDTGARPQNPKNYPQLLRVSRAMAAEDRRREVQALLLLGDNFYWRGLRAAELEERIRVNVVAPFCRFVELEGPRSAEVADACKLPPADRHPVPIYAVLGNHDYMSEESPALQRDALPRFVSNWRMAEQRAALVELEPGVSLIAVDSELVYRDGDTAALRDALRRSRGPWRIVFAHRPLFALTDSIDSSGGHRGVRRYVRLMRDAIASSGVPVHLFLAGHRHNLQLLRGEPPGPALHAIAGGGSDTSKLRGDEPARLAAVEAHGYARVDLVGDASAARLVVSLYRLPPGPLRLVPEWQWRVARYSVDRDGNIAAE
jgi:hypothetical protein